LFRYDDNYFYSSSPPYRFFSEDLHAGPTSRLPSNDPIEEPSRADFEEACNQFHEAGLARHSDRTTAWQQYEELRSRYATAVNFLAKITMVPEVKPV
jgi:hypothetical protein